MHGRQGLRQGVGRRHEGLVVVLLVHRRWWWHERLLHVRRGWWWHERLLLRRLREHVHLRVGPGAQRGERGEAAVDRGVECCAQGLGGRVVVLDDDLVTHRQVGEEGRRHGPPQTLRRHGDDHKDGKDRGGEVLSLGLNLNLVV